MAGRRPPLELEELTPRTLLSATTPVDLGYADAFAHLASTNFRLSCVGHGHGGFSVSGNPDTGLVYHFQGAGKLVGLGDVEVGGTLHGVGYVHHGHAYGTLTFFNVWGSVTVEVTGPDQHGFALPTGQFNFQVISRTGGGQIVPLPDRSYADLTLTPPTSHVHHGKFVLSI
jgi:hypothetical protein